MKKAKEHFLQYNCYIDKDVKYLASGLKNVSTIKHSTISFGLWHQSNRNI